MSLERKGITWRRQLFKDQQEKGLFEKRVDM